MSKTSFVVTHMKDETLDKLSCQHPLFTMSQTSCAHLMHVWSYCGCSRRSRCCTAVYTCCFYCHAFDRSKPKRVWLLGLLPSAITQGLHTPHQVLLAPKPFAPACRGPLPAFLACRLCALSLPLKMAGKSTAGRSSACR